MRRGALKGDDGTIQVSTGREVWSCHDLTHTHISWQSMTNRITPFLCFDDHAGETMKFHTSTFKNSKMGKEAHEQ